MSLVSRRFLRLSITVGIILILIFGGLHIWFRYNAKQFLTKKVHDESQGKFSLELKGFTFNYLTNYIEIRKAALVSTDTISQAATYNVQFNKLSLHVSSFIPLLIQRKLLLDSVKIYDPNIEVTRWRPDTSASNNTADVSIPREMGKMYNSLLDALDVFGIKRIVIDNGRFSLINKMHKEQQPVVITNIHLNLVRTAEAPKERDVFVKGKQTVDLFTNNQSIRLPNGRHILTFKKFELQLFRKHIQLDSCIVVALPTDSTNSSYTIFFDKLLLVGVDFNAMYERNLIRADSVYCENPVFNIQLDLKDATAANKIKTKPDLEKIIREITGDLELGFVGVNNAGIRIDITGGRTRTLSNSKKDDFKMYGLKINQDSAKPVSVDRFDMVVRDYRLYSADSSSAYGFDSIHFVNNKVLLNNFTVATSSGLKGVHNQRDFKIPYFELTGLDWYELIFNETIKAREAVLYNPVINYTRRAPAKKRTQGNLFQTLATLDSLMVLNKIRVVNGTLNMKMGATAFNLQNTNLDLNSSRLLQSDNITDVRSAVQALSFSNGAIRLKDNLVQLKNVRYTGNNLIEADRLNITSTSNKINASAGNILIKNIFINEKTESIIIDGIGWKFAKINLRTDVGKGNAQKNSGSISIKNISGYNTNLNIATGKTTVSTFIESLKLSSLTKPGAGSVQIEGLTVKGNTLSVKNGPLQINSSSYQINSSQPSYLNQFSLIKNQLNDSLEVRSPRITFIPDINAILSKNIYVNSVDAQAPYIRMSKWNSGEKKQPSGEAPSIRIDRISATNPSIYVATHRNDSVGIINLPRTASNSITATDLLINKEGTAIGTLAINTTTGTFAKRNGEIIGVDDGKVDVQFANIRLNNTGAKPFWSVLVNQFHLQNPNTLYLGPKRNKLFMQEASVGNVQLSSELVTDYSKLIRFNVSAWLRTATGQYIDSTTTLKWFNAGYDSRNKTLSLDSFIYHPTQSLDSVVAYTPYQTDYITLQTGPLQITDFNLEKYNKDSAIIANTVNISRPVITVHRDKRPPFLGGIIKPLPVNMIKAIAVPVSLQRVNIINGNLSYTEVNEKTGAEGTVLLTHLNGALGNIKNRNIHENDSLSLTLNAYLMDSALLNLKVKESYTDSLAGFLMTLRLRPTSLTFLNPVLAPLSNVQIVSGTIDSFHLRAIGRETLSLGEMNMYYRNLRIKLVKGGDPDKSTFLLDVVSFLANTFIIKKNNNGRTGIVYFERLRDRSFFNYIVKMTFSGMATSVGAKKNRKYLKKYRQELKDQKLPAIEFE